MGRTNGSGDDSAAGGAGGKALQQGHLDSAGFAVVADRKTTIPAARRGNGGGLAGAKNQRTDATVDEHDRKFVLTAVMVILLVKMGSTLKLITPLVLVAALLIAIGSIAAIRLFLLGDPVVRQTIAVCNANRHVGLALLLSGQYLSAKNGLPEVFCYALVAPVVMTVYMKLNPVEKAAG